MTKIVKKVEEELLNIIGDGKKIITELVEATGINAFGISEILRNMEADGRIKIEKDKARKIYLRGKNEQTTT